MGLLQEVSEVPLLVVSRGSEISSSSALGFQSHMFPLFVSKLKMAESMDDIYTYILEHYKVTPLFESKDVDF